MSQVPVAGTWESIKAREQKSSKDVWDSEGRQWAGWRSGSLGFAVPGPAESVPFVHLPLILATPPKTSSSPLTWTHKQALPSPTPLGWGHSGGVGKHKT